MAPWQDAALIAGIADDPHPKRRVHGKHDLRFDGIADLMLRAAGRSVLDVGCNRAHTLYDFALNGASVVHGCDAFGPGMAAAKQWFTEVRDLESRFEVVDLRKGPEALDVFGQRRYNIVLMLGVYHKLKREMRADMLSRLMQNIGRRAIDYFGWSGWPDELTQIDAEMAACGLHRVQTSEIAGPGHPAAIWASPI